MVRPYRFHKFDGASGCSDTERYFREGMLALPYGVSRNYVAQAVAVVPNGTLGRTCESAPTDGYHKFNGASGYV